MRIGTGIVMIAAIGLMAAPAAAQDSRVPALQRGEERMSAMGEVAARARRRIEAGAAARAAGAAPTIDAGRVDDVCQNDPSCPGGLREQAPGGQAELSIAIDSSGNNVVIGFNDTRGFSKNPVSVSGFMYSSDGGQTFTDGGQLPVTVPTSTIGTTIFPQVFGDPEVKYLGGCTFIYSSIMVKQFSATGVAQTMGVHRSTDCGHTWEGPFEVQAATNPTGLVTAGGSAADAADKEFMDVDPETGRVMMTWTNFGALAIEIRSAYSDDGGLTWPVTTGRIISATPADGQSSIPRFARNSSNAYVAWRRFPFPGTFFGFGNVIAFARSTDNGVTWGPPIELSPEFLTMDQVLGNDRVNTSPSLAVDRSGGPRDGTVYVVYANNNNQDGADIVFQKSTDEGLSFSPPLRLNSRPGNDRAQWFPWVSVDEVTGRVSVFYFDQGIARNGHLSEVTYTFSNDGGLTWASPRPLTKRPFKAGHGNDTGQPNLGDYNQGVGQGGTLWAAYALAARPPAGFTDGQPSTGMTVPDAEVKIVSAVDHAVPHAPLNLQTTTVSVNGGFADPGEVVTLKFGLYNYVTNPLNSDTVRPSVAVLTTSTPGVQVTQGVSLYPQISPGQTKSNQTPLRISLSPGFVAGTAVELTLTVVGLDGIATLDYTLFTGTPVATTLLTENFNAVTPGTLPAGWTAAHGGGANTVPWTTSSTFCGESNAAFHPNANDGPVGGSPVRFERLFSPAFVVPSTAQYVTVEFDVCYDTEEDPIFNVLAYDGFFLRITDLTTGRTLRSVLAEAFEDQFTTGEFNHYPRHFPRSSNPAYFQDMSAWAGTSGGVRKRVRLRLPGMEGSTAQLRFEYTQDSFGTCKDVRPGSAQCGVLVDNVVVKSVVPK